jgi:hypothetical protein
MHPRDQIALISIFLLTACGRHAVRKPRTEPATGAGAFVVGGSGSARIEYQPAARIIARKRSLEVLRAVSRDGSTLALDLTAPEIAGLGAGQIIVLEGVTARRVILADTAGRRIYALTEPVTLGDVVHRGHIEFNAPVHFQARTATSSHHGSILHDLADLAVPAAYAQDAQDPIGDAYDKGKAAYGAATKVVKAVTNGWHATYTATPSRNRLDLSITLTRDVWPVRAIIQGKGYLTDFDVASGIDVDDGIVQRLEMANRRMNGVMNFSWTVSTGGPGEFNRSARFKLPSPIKIPLAEFVGGLPLFLEIGGAVIVKPALTGGKEYSHGAFRITYDGYQRFEAKAGSIDAEGNVTGDMQFLESQNVSALAPHGIVVAVAAPRIELTLGISDVDFSPLDEAAGNVDKYSDLLLRTALTPEQYAAYRSSMFGDVKFSDFASMAESALQSNAQAYIEIVTSSGMSFTGISAIAPCTRTEINLWAKVGAAVTAIGQDAGSTEKEIYHKSIAHVDPPGVARLCHAGES